MRARAPLEGQPVLDSCDTETLRHTHSLTHSLTLTHTVGGARVSSTPRAAPLSPWCCTSWSTTTGQAAPQKKRKKDTQLCGRAAAVVGEGVCEREWEWACLTG